MKPVDTTTLALGAGGETSVEDGREAMETSQSNWRGSGFRPPPESEDSLIHEHGGPCLPFLCSIIALYTDGMRPSIVAAQGEIKARMNYTLTALV